jgi:hypothetical protein
MPSPEVFQGLRRPWSREAKLLALTALVGLALRLWRAWYADWYWDEGYVTEISRDLANFQRPHAGALWFNGLLPLTTSWLTPLTIVPFHWLIPGPSLWAVRVWGCCLDAVNLLLVGWIGQRLAGWRAGLSASLILAIGPLPVALGALGVYHHLGATLALLAWASALRNDDEDFQGVAWAPYLWAGLSAAACYWLWWVSLGILLRRPARRACAWPLRLALALGPAALTCGLTLGLGGEDAQGMARVLNGFVAPWGGLSSLWFSAKSYPLVWFGLALLPLLPKKERWGLVVWIGMADAVRQRGNLTGSPYVLLVLLPWACLGAGLALQWMAARSRALALVALALFLGCAATGSIEWIERLSTPAALGRNLANFIRAQRLGDATIVATPEADWNLRALCRPVEPSQAAAWRGWNGGFLPGHLSKAAFAYDPSLEKAHFLVVSHLYFDCLYLDPHLSLEVLVAEYEGWQLVFKNPVYVVYANPRFGTKKNPEIRILHDPKFYWLAASAARQLGHPEWAAFARARAKAGFVP